MNLTPDQWTKVILAVVALIGAIITAIFAVNKRSHKIRDIGNDNTIINGDGNIEKDK